MDRISITISVADISLYLPMAIFMSVQLRKPQMIPCVIEKVNGMSTIARKAGMASSMVTQFIFRTGFSINTPTSISAGAVAIIGTMESSGDRNMKGINNMPATRAVKPVRPPCCTPAADSI